MSRMMGMVVPYSFQSNLHRAGELYYDSLPWNEKEALEDIYETLDANGDGLVSQAELVRAFEGSSMHKMAASVGTLFSLLDKDRNGYMDLQECKALLFLTSADDDSGNAFCNHCNTFILDNLTFMCHHCWKLRDSFNLCLKCYPFKASIHPSDHVFAPRNRIVNQALRDALLMVQCVICGDYHKKDISKHVVKRADGYVCEWCFTWFCTNCGQCFQDIPGATPGQWLLDTFNCKSCGQMGTKTNRDQLIEKLKKSTVVQECSTCRIKAKNDILWASAGGQSSVQISEISSAPSSSNALVKYVAPSSSSNALEIFSGITNTLGNVITTAIQVGTSCTIL